jgi:EAL domain-containing protein (putative c-di-GMP-specific phosphodiesterase class I)
MSLAEARQAWPDTLFWSNINIACYALPPDELKALIAERAAQAAPDGSKLAFEVSEQLPVNWYDSLRVVLDTLREIA